MSVSLSKGYSLIHYNLYALLLSQSPNFRSNRIVIYPTVSFSEIIAKDQMVQCDYENRVMRVIGISMSLLSMRERKNGLAHGDGSVLHPMIMQASVSTMSNVYEAQKNLTKRFDSVETESNISVMSHMS